jgi:hypothetical protein
MAQWGSYKDDHSVLTFHQTILSTRPFPQNVTQYDTLLAQSIINQNDVWIRQVTNPLTGERLQHPLQNDITILKIFHAQNYTTLITNNNRYYYYECLGLTVPNTISHMYEHLRHWYNTSIKPPVLRQLFPTIHTPYTPQQTDG